MVTIYDIAKKANVSAMTVSRVINNTGKISEKTRRKVKQVMEELNYVPNHMARSLVTQQTKILYLLITDITNPFYTTLSRGAEDAARQSGYCLLFGNSDESLDKEKEYINTILTTRVDGVLIAPTGDLSFPHLKKLQQHHIPFVLLDREVPGIDCDIVLGDSRDNGRRLVEYLISQGHRRIAMINGSSNISSARMRKQGYIDGLKLNDLPYDEKYVHETGFGSTHDWSDIEAWMEQMHPFPTALIAGNNVLAVETIKILKAKGYAIPQDLSVVGFDELGPYSEVDPFLTVISQQAYQFGFIGMQMLIERIQNKDNDSTWKKIVLPSDLIIRRSVKKLK